MPRPLTNILHRSDQLSATMLNISTRYVMAKNTKVSLTVESTMPTEAYGLASLLMQFLVGPMCTPLIAQGTVTAVSVESHRNAKNPTTYRLA